MYKSEIISLLQQTVILHPDINSTNYGSEFEENVNGNDIYPLAFIETETSSLDISERVNNHSFAILFLDQHAEDAKSTILDKQLKMEKAMLDFVAFLKKGGIEGIVLEDPNSAISLFEYNSDINAGWRLELSLVAAKPTDRCNLDFLFSGNAPVDENIYLPPLEGIGNPFIFRKNVSFEPKLLMADDGEILTVDLNTGNLFFLTWAGDTELNYTNGKVGTYQFIIKNQTTSSNITLTANKFKGVEMPVLTATAEAMDILTATYDGERMLIVQASNFIDL